MMSLPVMMLEVLLADLPKDAEPSNGDYHRSWTWLTVNENVEDRLNQATGLMPLADFIFQSWDVAWFWLLTQGWSMVCRHSLPLKGLTFWINIPSYKAKASHCDLTFSQAELITSVFPMLHVLPTIGSNSSGYLKNWVPGFRHLSM